MRQGDSALMSEPQSGLPRKRAELVLTPIEMTYIARLIGADSLFGIGDPFFGWLTEEIREAWAKAHEGLKARKVIEEGSEGVIRVDVVAGGALAVCSKPEARIILQVKARGEDEQTTVFNVTRGLCVGHALAADPQAPLTLALFEGPRDVAEEIISIAGLSGGDSAGSVRLKSSMYSLWAAVEAAEKEPQSLPAAVTRLCKGEEGRAELEKTLMSGFRLVSAVRLIDGEGEGPPKTAVFLGNGRFLWEIKPEFSGEDVAIHLSLTDAERAKAAFLGMIGM